MTTQDNQARYARHAIQLVALKVLDLSIRVNPDIADPYSQQIEDAEFAFTSGHTQYDGEDHKIGIKISAEIGMDKEKFPYSLRAELVGIFDVDESRFPIMHIESWATTNGPLVLYPYLREHVYGLTTRAGFNGALLPLFEIPTFKVSMP